MLILGSKITFIFKRSIFKTRLRRLRPHIVSNLNLLFTRVRVIEIPANIGKTNGFKGELYSVGFHKYSNESRDLFLLEPLEAQKLIL